MGTISLGPDVGHYLSQTIKNCHTFYQRQKILSNESRQSIENW